MILRPFRTLLGRAVLTMGVLGVTACGQHSTPAPGAAADTHAYLNHVIPVDQAPLVIDGCPVQAFFVEDEPNYDVPSDRHPYSQFADRVYVAHCNGTTTVSAAQPCGKACSHSVVTVMPEASPSSSPASPPLILPASPSEIARAMIVQLNHLPAGQRAQVLKAVTNGTTAPSP